MVMSINALTWILFQLRTSVNVLHEELFVYFFRPVLEKFQDFVYFVEIRVF